MTEYACYFFINKRLKMSSGKIGAQVSHGTRYLCRNIDNQKPFVRESWNNWENGLSRTLLLYAKDEDEMEELHNRYPSHKVIDAGLTQVPANSFTVLALFPKEYIPKEFPNKLV